MSYDREERTLNFSKSIIGVCRTLSNGVTNKRIVDQLIRSSTSIGANYREANETDTKKDFRNRIRIAKKEAKETVYWIELLKEANPNIDGFDDLIDESRQLMRILGSIYEKA